MKSGRCFAKWLILVAFYGFLSAAWGAADLVGDDTDLFTVNPAIKSEIPNILIVVDNTANWSNNAAGWGADSACVAVGITGTTQGDAERCAIYKAIAKTDDKGNYLYAGVATLGLMMLQDREKGGYVRFANRLITPTAIADLANVLKAITVGDPKDEAGANAAYEPVMEDVFRYFNGFAVKSGAAPENGGQPDMSDTQGYTDATKTVFFPPDRGGGVCGNNYVIFIGNSNANAGWDSVALSNAALLLQDPNAVPNLGSVTGNNTGLNADRWTRFMKQYGVQLTDGTGAIGYRPIITYAINVCNLPPSEGGTAAQYCDKNAPDKQQTTGLFSMSEGVGGGKYFRATDLGQIDLAFDFIFKQILAVNSVFASVSLPVSVSVRGTNANQVYIGVFRPDEKRRPRWPGNLKLYNLGCQLYADGTVNSACDTTNTQLELKDQAGLPAANPLTSFINTNVSSFWTVSSRTAAGAGSGFWAFRGPVYDKNDIGEDDDKPDGSLVEKGGAAEMLRITYPLPDSAAAQTRKLYTCTGACAGGDPTTSPGTLLGSSDDTNFIVDNVKITSALLGTLQYKTVKSLTASGTLARVVTTDPHGFTGGAQKVTISGAYPTLFNTTSAGVSFSVDGPDSFTYTLSSAPNSTNAWVQTTAGHGLLGGDKVTVTGASPAGFNATAAAVTLDANDGASGTKAFFYAPSDLATAVGVASGYAVTPVYSLAAHAAALSYSSATSKATLTMTGHGFADGDRATISGVTPAEFNCAAPGCLVTKIDNDRFTYVPIPAPTGGSTTTAVATTDTTQLRATDTIKVTGASPTSYNTAGVNFVPITNFNSPNGTFSYAASGTLTGPATTVGTVTKQWMDTDTWKVSSGSADSTSGKRTRTITLNINSGTASVESPTHTFAIGDPITVTGVSCTSSSALTCSGNFTVSARTATSVSYVTRATTNPPVTVNVTGSATVTWMGNKTKNVTVSGLDRGAYTVPATVTSAYLSKIGGLTAQVSSISNQATATGTIKAALAGTSDPNERENLINWVRGKDNLEDENKDSNLAFADIRASVHGDVLHSRPAVINYNRSTIANSGAYGAYPRTLEAGNNDVYVFYGANDGIFHAIKAGYGMNGGKEAWGFVPSEFFGKLKRLRDNSPLISSSQPRDYFFDGPVTVYTHDQNADKRLVAANGDHAFLFMGMRRGGRMLYALDVSDPDSPRMMWKKGCPNPSGTLDCDAGYEELGQTWSEPSIGYLRAFPDFPVLIFGAGYDARVEDIQPCLMTANTSTDVTAPLGGAVSYNVNGTCTQTGGTSTTVSRTMGRGLYIVNALTGEVVWRVGPTVLSSLAAAAQRLEAGMTHAMPSDVAALNRDRDSTRVVVGTENVGTGYLDRVYIPDTGGNVWRIDVDDADTTKWVVTKIAALSDTNLADKRKFLYRPDVVRGSDSAGAFDALLLGSGDREHPFDTSVTNRFYMLKDRAVGLDATGQATIRESDLYNTTSTLIDASKQAALDAKKGWYITLNGVDPKTGTTSPGEKTVSSATTLGGNAYFNTFQPKTTMSLQCVSDLGTARDYIVNYLNSNPVLDRNGSGGALTSLDRSTVNLGGGYLPSPVGTIVVIGGKPYSTVLKGPTTATTPGAAIGDKSRTYRYRKMN